MHTKTMEGLVGARTNMNLLHTPFRVYQEAKQKGDLGKMEQAMDYVNKCSDKVEQYRAEADQGMEEDAKEAKEKTELELENIIQKRRLERQELEERITEDKNKNVDTVDISEDGKIVLKENADIVQSGQLDFSEPVQTTAESMKLEPVIYANTGKVSTSQSKSSTAISVSV